MKRKLRLLILALCAIFLLTACTTAPKPNDVDDPASDDPALDDPVSNDPLTVAIANYFNYCELCFQFSVAETGHLAESYTSINVKHPLSDAYSAARAAVNTTDELLQLASERAEGLLSYVTSADMVLLSWNTSWKAPVDIATAADGSVTCLVSVGTSYVWYNSDFSTPIESGFGSTHTLTLTPDAQGGYRVVADIYNEWDISGINTSGELPH